ncbi:MAG: type II secretion system F family protein [Candidatus Micrarchaeota archaeon]|nr:type II secretion system F family protein [Candidatus Micrarchaeota archaeon]
MVQKLIEAIGRLLQRENVKKIGKKISEAGFEMDAEYAAGLFFLYVLFSLIISVGISLFLFKNPIIIIFSIITVTVILVGLLYQYIELKIDERRNEIEKVLPDFLQLAAANVRAGMQIEKALWYAAKPEFGLLSKEMEIASKRMFGGETINEALDKMAERINSRYFDRTVELIKEGIESGGEIAGILEKTALDLRNQQIMKKEISTSMIMYSIFIGFSAAVGAPFLYVVSSKLISLFEKLWVNQPISGFAANPYARINPISPAINSTEFNLFAITIIIITTFIATLIISVIQTGRKSNFIKYIFPFLVVSLLVFYVGRIIIDRIFGGISL